MEHSLRICADTIFKAPKTITVTLIRKDGKAKVFPIDTYVRGVVASEIGDAPLEACKAQAIAARTNAYVYAISGNPIPDVGVQAFREERATDESYRNVIEAVRETTGYVLLCDGELLDPCSFSASNGGKTESSETRWGGYRSYLIEQNDPFDYAVTHGVKRGHGVGMSQTGAIEMSKCGKNYEEILGFYYPGSTIYKGVEEKMANVKASF